MDVSDRASRLPLTRVVKFRVVAAILATFGRYGVSCCEQTAEMPHSPAGNARAA